MESDKISKINTELNMLTSNKTGEHGYIADKAKDNTGELGDNADKAKYNTGELRDIADKAKATALALAEHSSDIEPEPSSEVSKNCNRAPRYCGLCILDERKKDAVGFCISCTEFLCQRCQRNHSRIKVTSSHTVLQGEHIPEDVEQFTALRNLLKCKFHEENNISHLCTDHSVHICVLCVTDNHSDCKLEKLYHQKNTDDIRKDTSLTENVLSMEKRIKDCMLNREKYLSEIEEGVIEEGRDLAQMMERIEKFKSDFDIQVFESVNMKKSIAQTCINDCNSLQCDVDRTKILMDTAFKYGTDDECVIVTKLIHTTCNDLMNKIIPFEKQLVETQDDRQSIMDKMTHINTLHFDGLWNVTCEMRTKLSLSEEQRTKDVYVACDIITSKRSVETCDKEVQTLGIQTLLTNPPCRRPFIEKDVSKSAYLYNISTPTDKHVCSITAVEKIVDGMVLLADRSNMKLKLISGSYVVLDEYKLTGHPIDVCVVGKDIYVCFSDKNTIARFQISDDRTLHPVDGFDLQYSPMSISRFKQGVIILCSQEEECFDFVEKQGVIFEIRNDDGLCRSLYGEWLYSFNDDERNDDEYMDNDDEYQEDDCTYDNYQKNNNFDDIHYAKRILCLDDSSVILAENNHLSCYNVTGPETLPNISSRNWFYKQYRRNRLQNARGLATDDERNVYICGTNTNNIHQVSSSNYRKNRVLISGIPNPYCIRVDSEKDRLIVGCCGDNYLHVFEFK